MQKLFNRIYQILIRTEIKKRSAKNVTNLTVLTLSYAFLTFFALDFGALFIIQLSENPANHIPYYTSHH